MTNRPRMDAALRQTEEPRSWLRLYIAGATPNSARAEENLRLALQAWPKAACLELTVIDVFIDGRRALLDDVIVTPTLILSGPRGRSVLMGDLTDQMRLHSLLSTISEPLSGP